MAGRLWISATLLSGRYHGSEWPPSPARLVQALVAGSKNGGNRENWPEVEQGLRWLECQPAPRIFARPAKKLTPYKMAVPNNDLDVIARDWLASKPASIATIRTMKTIEPRLIEGPVPHLRYVWDINDSQEGSRAAGLLKPAALCLYSLGWGVDMAYADSGLTLTDEEQGWDEWVPSSRGDRMAVPVPGFLDDLEATHKRFTLRAAGQGVDTDTRIRVYRLQVYARRGVSLPPWIAFGLKTPNGEDQFSTPWRNSMEVSAWMRHAAKVSLTGEDIGEDLNSFVLGHPDDADAASHRLSFVPLPSIHALHGDCRIRRIMVVEPLGGSGRAIESLSTKWIGQSLLNDHKVIQCEIESADGRVTPLYTKAARRIPRSRVRCQNREVTITGL